MNNQYHNGAQLTDKSLKDVGTARKKADAAPNTLKRTLSQLSSIIF
jgi:hypothetical protein